MIYVLLFLTIIQCVLSLFMLSYVITDGHRINKNWYRIGKKYHHIAISGYHLYINGKKFI